MMMGAIPRPSGQGEDASTFLLGGANMSISNRELVERYLGCYNGKDVEAMLAFFAEDAVFESVSNTTGVIRTAGKEQLRQLAHTSVDYFEQRRQTPVAWVIDETHVAVEIDYWCRLAKDLPDGHKAGAEMRLRGASFFTIQGGRITRLVDYM